MILNFWVLLLWILAIYGFSRLIVFRGIFTRSLIPILFELFLLELLFCLLFCLFVLFSLFFILFSLFLFHSFYSFYCLFFIFCYLYFFYFHYSIFIVPFVPIIVLAVFLAFVGLVFKFILSLSIILLSFMIYYLWSIIEAPKFIFILSSSLCFLL
jgi:hypothetical protein